MDTTGGRLLMAMIVVCAVGVVSGAFPTSAGGPLVLTQAIDPCATGETPCDPNRPWMRGSVEKSCATASQLARAKQEYPDRIILACKCKHMCVPTDPHAQETDGRKWDATCEARCNPNHCGCPHPCDERARQ